MLTVYTRHSQKCPQRDDIAWRRCRCPKWIQGTPSEDHEFLRTSAATRTWEQAEEKARKLEEEARPGARKTAPAITIEEAVAAYHLHDLRTHVGVAVLDGLKDGTQRDVVSPQFDRVNVHLVLPQKAANRPDLGNSRNRVQLITDEPVLK